MKKNFLLLSVLLVLSSQVMQTMMDKSNLNINIKVFNIKMNTTTEIIVFFKTTNEKNHQFFKFFFKNFHDISQKITALLEKNREISAKKNDENDENIDSYKDKAQKHGANFFSILSVLNTVSGKTVSMPIVPNSLVKEYVRKKYIFFSIITIIGLFGLKKYAVTAPLISFVIFSASILIIKIAVPLCDVHLAPLDTEQRMSNLIAVFLINHMVKCKMEISSIDFSSCSYSTEVVHST